MEAKEIDRLTLHGDTGKRACGIRLAAARKAMNLDQKEISSHAKTSVANYSHMENARSFPNREVKEYLYLHHRIDYNFLEIGAWQQLAGDVQTLIFESLKEIQKRTNGNA